MPQFTLDQITLENFRSYLKNTKINLGSRITLLFGKGSVGKSTIIDAIQMMHASEKNDVDIFEKNFKYILSKNGSSDTFNIGLKCSEKSKKDQRIIGARSINKVFKLDNKDNFYPKTVDLYSDSDDPGSKFLSISNEPLPTSLSKDRNFRDFFISKVLFIENEFAWKELFEYTLKYKKELIENLNKCAEFSKNYIELLQKAKKEKDPKKAEEINEQRLALFQSQTDNFSPWEFRPSDFPLGTNNIKKHADFLIKLNEKTKYKDFIEYVSKDIKNVQRFLYKNNKLYKRDDLRRSYREASDKFIEKLSDLYKENIPSVKSSFAEFLCVSLTELCTARDFDPTDPDMPPPFINEDSFRWKIERNNEKILSPKGMFRVCNDTISPTLEQIKTVRHQENINKIIESLSPYASSIASRAEFHETIERNLKDINKWLGEFEYDFKISIDKVGVKGETEIMQKKNKYKIPYDLGGSGAQFLLTYLTTLIDSKESTILLEEPEKALHASLQIKLAKFFSEISKNNQLVIETHSENLLLGLLKEIRDKKIKPEEVSVLYIYMENGISKVDHLELNEKGGFKSKWRDGFFTEKLDLL